MLLSPKCPGPILAITRATAHGLALGPTDAKLPMDVSIRNDGTREPNWPLSRMLLLLLLLELLDGVEMG